MNYLEQQALLLKLRLVKKSAARLEASLKSSVSLLKREGDATEKTECQKNQTFLLRHCPKTFRAVQRLKQALSFRFKMAWQPFLIRVMAHCLGRMLSRRLNQRWACSKR